MAMCDQTCNGNRFWKSRFKKSLLKKEAFRVLVKGWLDPKLRFASRMFDQESFRDHGMPVSVDFNHVNASVQA